MQYRRARVDGGTYFFTLVTYNRHKFLCETDNVSLLRSAFRYVMNQHPFKIDAFVLLPEHLHCIWTLPSGDWDFSTRWRLIKSYFSRLCAPQFPEKFSTSRQNKKEKSIWQRRFWEHCIRDEKDFTAHVEYIHYNPVKHGLVKSPKDWEYSSFHRYVREGIYDVGWGAEEKILFNQSIIGNE
ncbi:MAG: transposase [Stigonema ocellatum SAG 48.90 = DSM 106950]|nr:transposase [Stigonema ocellatum SAG 48.90 = DSM 106950]